MDLGSHLSLWSIIPFVGMLLSIAILPLVKGEWWEKHQLHGALFWAFLFLIPFAIAFGLNETVYELMESVVLDYIPFIVLLLGLFVVAGNIHVGGAIAGTTRNNVILLAIGTFFASWVGTTGAAMLLIRPVLRANQWRKYKTHIVVFFIFMVANMGGCLTPLGDPPLFLGYLRGVPFFWTMSNIWPILLMNAVILLVVFVLLDRHFVKREGEEGQAALALQIKASKGMKLHLDGAHNIIFLAVIIFAVIINGVIPQIDAFVDANGQVIGVDVWEGIHLGINYFIQIALILAAALGSWCTTKASIREDNDFEWAPITEVAKLFIGIFITMIPALALLRTYGSTLGIDSPLKFFWITGALSSFLDNSPTYVVFLTTAGSLGASAGVGALTTTVGVVAEDLLLAISAGAVFMGAITYIGNAPNFMVKSISERSGGVKMPSFFGYMGWSCSILIPLFIIDTIVFFL
jgi:Na+/H+ antiporter NhaD/arsenite permease-like protein